MKFIKLAKLIEAMKPYLSDKEVKVISSTSRAVRVISAPATPTSSMQFDALHGQGSNAQGLKSDLLGKWGGISIL